MGAAKLYELSQALGRRLQDRGWQLTTAESCTGGWIAQAVTAVSGSSAYFPAGFVTYSNQAKQRHLDVPTRYLEGPDAPGAVSEDTVLAMARGALVAEAADLAVSTSGVAGPGGGSAAKPVGTVWIGWALRRDGEPAVYSRARAFHFDGDRESVRYQSVVAALEGLLELVDNQDAASERDTG